MFSKASDEWSTPPDVYAALDREFTFRMDAAASPENFKWWAWFGPEHTQEIFRDALAVDWWDELGGPEGLAATVWLNPPYSKCREFIAKAAAEAAKGCTVVCLVPSRTDTRWWHAHVWDETKHQPRPGVEIRFVRGRLKFGGATAGAPFPSVVIVFRPVVSA
jgi:site-specific DNA-methyltransferase (adenine-specific)